MSPSDFSITVLKDISKDFKTLMSKLEKDLAWYAAYHSNPTNKVIHCVTVPLLLVSGVTGLRNFANAGSMTFFGGSRIALNFPTAIITGYSLYYLYLDAPSGALWAFLQGAPILAIANHPAVQRIENLTLVSAAVHAALWFVQVSVGHGIFEKRKPALMDGFVQAVSSSPLFVLLEVLLAVGYKKELAEKVAHRAKLIRAEMDAKAKAKSLESS